MKAERLIILLFLFFLCLVAVSCEKGERNSSRPIEGSITLKVNVKHHSWGVGPLDVYLKKDVTEWPGTDISKYDFHVTTNQNGNCEFNQLFPGDYFLYATGYDPIFRDSVLGYIPVEINEINIVNLTREVTLYVSE